MLYLLGKRLLFSKIIIISQCCQLEIDDQNKDETTSISHHERFRSLGLLFLLKKPPRTVQIAIDVSLSSVEWQMALKYSENTVIILRFLKDYLHALYIVQRMLSRFSASLELKNLPLCRLLHLFCGIVKRARQTCTLEESKAAHLRWNVHRFTVEDELKSILALCQWFHASYRFCSGSAAPVPQVEMIRDCILPNLSKLWWSYSRLLRNVLSNHL